MTEKPKHKLYAGLKGHHLVLDCAAANPPVLTLLDVRAIANASFFVQPSPEGFRLGYVPDKGGLNTLAVFVSAEDAENVRAQIASAFLGRARILRCLKKLILFAAILFAALWLLNAVLGVVLSTIKAQPASQPAPAMQQSAAPSISAPAQPGMPMDADQRIKPAGE